MRKGWVFFGFFLVLILIASFILINNPSITALVISDTSTLTTTVIIMGLVLMSIVSMLAILTRPKNQFK